MPGGRDPDRSEGDPSPRLSLGHRLLLALPRLRRDGDRAPFGERLRNAVLKPVEPGTKPTGTSVNGSDELSVEELETAARFASDQERLIGLFAAPVGAAIGLVVINYLIAHDPPALLPNGTTNKAHVSVSLYHSLTLVLLGLSLVMLASAFFRKRLFLGPVRAGRLQPPLLGLRHPLPLRRRLAAGAVLPPAARPRGGHRGTVATLR
jgi:hypothetical protein